MREWYSSGAPEHLKVWNSQVRGGWSISLSAQPPYSSLSFCLGSGERAEDLGADRHRHTRHRAGLVLQTEIHRSQEDQGVRVGWGRCDDCNPGPPGPEHPHSEVQTGAMGTAGLQLGLLSSLMKQQDFNDGLALVQVVNRGTMSGDDKHFHFLRE